MPSQPISTPEKLTATPMFDFAFTKILKAGKEFQKEPQVQVFEPEGDNPTYALRFTAENKSIFLLSPASDDVAVDMRNLGTTPLFKVLMRVQDLQRQDSETIYLLPLVECQLIYRDLLYRQHAVMLMIKGKDCYLFDPRSDSFISFSWLYNFKPLEDCLAEQHFTLQESIYLSWQIDDINCGRFVAEIAGRAAEAAFTGKDLKTIRAVLKNSPHKPDIESLVAESRVCVTDRRIRGNQAICEVRWQNFLDSQVKIEDIQGLGHCFLNPELEKMSRFFISDCIWQDLKPKKSFSLYLQDASEPEAIEVSVSYLSERLGCDELTACQIIWELHNQNLIRLFQELLSLGIELAKTPRIMIGRFKDDMSIRIHTVDKNILFTYTFYRVPLLCLKNKTEVGSLEGPIELSFQLMQKQGKWGWQFKVLKTKNADILRIFKDECLPEEYFIDHHCHFPAVKIARNGDLTRFIDRRYVDHKLSLNHGGLFYQGAGVKSCLQPSPQPYLPIIGR